MDIRRKSAKIVLVVEDEALWRRWILSKKRARRCRERRRGDRILEQCTDIGMVFTDIDMPGSMDGMRLAAPSASAGRCSRSS